MLNISTIKRGIRVDPASFMGSAQKPKTQSIPVSIAPQPDLEQRIRAEFSNEPFRPSLSQPAPVADRALAEEQPVQVVIDESVVADEPIRNAEPQGGQAAFVEQSTPPEVADRSDEPAPQPTVNLYGADSIMTNSVENRSDSHQQPLHITSEIGVLKTVLLHRPGQELENITPEYMPGLLFDDIPYLELAQKEHDAFADVLRSRGVEVLYLDELVTEALANEMVREQFVDEMLASSKQDSRRATQSLRQFLLDLPTHAMVRKIMAGVRKDEITLPPEHHQQLHDMVQKDRYPFYLDPMPNLYFTRDPAAAVGQGLTINKMHWTARRRESLFMRYIIDHHPRFANKNVPVWYNRDEKFSMEGGDELVLSKETMAIGISERTTAEAIEKMATKLFAGSDFKKVIAMEIPKSHAFMHLDTVFTMIDCDTFTIHPEIRDHGGKINCFILEKVEGQPFPRITHETDLEHVLRVALSLPQVNLIECGGGDEIAAAREQWNDGSNTLAIAPGVVVTYDRNYITNQKLREAGIEVIEVSGSELGRGRGGPRCMSMPLVREDVSWQ